MGRRVCEALELRALLERQDSRGAQSRPGNRAAVNAENNKAFGARRPAEWIEILAAAEVPCGPIYAIDQMFADPQVRHIGAAVSAKSAKLGEIRIVNQAVGLSRTPARIATAPPELGEHTAEVLEELGYSRAGIEALRQKKVI